MPKRTRERQLAKLAARRASERRRRQRRRQLVAYGAAGAVLVTAFGLFLTLVRGGGEPRATGTPTPSASPTAEPGSQTGTVTPEPAPERVACGAEALPGAGEPKPQFAGPPPLAIDAEQGYRATLRTSCGRIVVELLPKLAPATVNSFVFLAERGFFDGQYLHRLDTGLDVLQGGDPTGTGTGGPGYTIPDELAGDEEYGPGTVAMANAGPDTGGSQFFIVAGPGGHRLDDVPAFTVFGRVVKGLDVAERILGVPVEDPATVAGQRPVRAVYLERVTISVEE